MGWKDVLSTATGGLLGNNKTDKLNKQAQDLRAQAADIKNKDISELQQEGRAAAGTAAAGKASEAKKAAKSAAMQTGGNKLQAATASAGAAGQAATEGFDATSQAYTQMAGNVDAAQKNAERQALQTQAAGLESEAAREQARKQQMMQTAATLAGGFASSDETKKKVKHTYIPADQRVKRGDK